MCRSPKVPVWTCPSPKLIGPVQAAADSSNSSLASIPVLAYGVIYLATSQFYLPPSRPSLNNLWRPCRHTCTLAHFHGNDIVLVVKGESPYLRRASLVPVMQSTNLRYFDHFSHLRGLHGSRLRGILGK